MAQPAQATASDLIERLVAELEPLLQRHNQALWAASVSGAAADAEERARLDTQVRTLFSRREPYQQLCRLKEGGEVGDPLVDRQVALLVDQFRAHQIPAAMIQTMVRIETALDHRFNNFRAELDGEQVSDNQIRRILRESDDGDERRRAWEASKQIGAEVVAELLELARCRNQAARQVGFDNYYSMMLELDELREDELFGLLDEVERSTRPLFLEYKADLDRRLGRRFGLDATALQPWHYGDPFFQEAPAADLDLDPFFRGASAVGRVRGFFAAIGLEIDELIERADLYEKPGKSQHAFCLSVDRRQDIRVLANVREDEFWTNTLLHEFGHAVYEREVDPSLPFLLRQPAHTLTTEASAMLFGRLTKNAAWLRRYAGMSPREAREAAATAARAMRCQLLVQTRWCLVMSHMERALYRDPERDLNRLWWELVERFQLVRRPDQRTAPDWASKIHFSVAPVYYHNYVLGEMMASQLQSHILHRVIEDGPEPWKRFVSSPAVGRYLIERLYRSGRSLDWRGTLHQATGGALSAAAFVDALAGRE
jgi:peptidyl-dipeptidase A